MRLAPPPTVKSPAERRAPRPEPAALRLETALQLLAQSGRAPPEGQPGQVAWLQSLIDALVDLSSRDALTGLANRRSFELALAREVDRVARSGEPALLLVLDIDHFKRVNDCVRPMDLVARIGGEEFAIILPNCPAAFGATVAERVRRRIEHTSIQISPQQQIEVTISIGGAFAPQWVRSTPALWIERADLQLYRAKSQGRNLVQLEPVAVSLVSNEERRMLFDTFQSEDHE